MSIFVTADYSLEVPLPNGHSLTHQSRRKRTEFSLDHVSLLRLDISEKKPPYLSFTDTNVVWRFANARPLSSFLDVWMATAISQMSRKCLIWEGFSRIFCPETIIYLNGPESCVIASLARGIGASDWSVEFVQSGQKIERREESAIACLHGYRDVYLVVS